MSSLPILRPSLAKILYRARTERRQRGGAGLLSIRAPTDLLNPANVAWSLGTNLLAPIFDGGARQAQVEISTADQKQAVAAYGQTALTASQEVETSLDQNVVLRERNVALDEAAKQAREALRVARLRYNEGETDLLDVLTIQQRVFTTESSLVNVERAGAEQWVNLNLALGGSWE